MIRKAKELKVELEGEGHSYRDGTPGYRVLGISKELHTTEALQEHGWEEDMVVLDSADSSFAQQYWQDS